MKIEMTEADKEIIAKHSSGARGRALLELVIVDALIQAATNAGYRLNIEDEEEYGSVSNEAEFKLALFNLDEATVAVFSGDGRKTLGWIQLTFNNDGYDLISDYSVNLEEFLKPVNEVAKLWGN